MVIMETIATVNAAVWLLVMINYSNRELTECIQCTKISFSFCGC